MKAEQAGDDDRAFPLETPILRARTLLTVVGGFLFMLAIMLFLAWLQPVDTENDKIELGQVFQIKLKPESDQKPAPKPETKRERRIEKRERPPAKKLAKRIPREAPPRAVSRPPTGPALRAPSGPTFNAAGLLGSGLGGGGASVNVSFDADQLTVAAEMAQVVEYDRQRKKIAESRGFLEEAQRRAGPVGPKSAPAKAIYIRDPKYPATAKSKNIRSGWVSLNVLISREGKVVDHVIVAAQPEGYFEDAIEGVLEFWTFRAAKDGDGRPIESWVDFTYEFELKGP